MEYGNHATPRSRILNFAKDAKAMAYAQPIPKRSVNTARSTQPTDTEQPVAWKSDNPLPGVGGTYDSLRRCPSARDDMRLTKGFASTLNLKLAEVAVRVKPRAVVFISSSNRQPPETWDPRYDDKLHKDSGHESTLEGEELRSHPGTRHPALQGGAVSGRASTREQAVYDQYTLLIDFDPLAFSSFTENCRAEHMNECWTESNLHPRGARYSVKVGPRDDDAIFVMPTGRHPGTDFTRIAA